MKGEGDERPDSPSPSPISFASPPDTTTIRRIFACRKSKMTGQLFPLRLSYIFFILVQTSCAYRKFEVELSQLLRRIFSATYLYLKTKLGPSPFSPTVDMHAAQLNANKEDFLKLEVASLGNREKIAFFHTATANFCFLSLKVGALACTGSSSGSACCISCGRHMTLHRTHTLVQYSSPPRGDGSLEGREGRLEIGLLFQRLAYAYLSSGWCVLPCLHYIISHSLLPWAGLHAGLG